VSQITAEVERTQRIIVTVDVAEFCEHYKNERADFDGDDEAYVRDFLDSEGGYLLDEFPSPDKGDGMTVEGDYDETDISILGVSA
jgi:hypothetical protein